MPTRLSALAVGLLAVLPFLLTGSPGSAQQTPQWSDPDEPRYPRRDDAYRPPAEPPRAASPRYGTPDAYPSEPQPPRYDAPPRTPVGRPPVDDAYRPPRQDAARAPNDAYSQPPRPGTYAEREPAPGQPYSQRGAYSQPYSDRTYAGPPGPGPQPYGRPYTPPGTAYDDPPERDYGPPPSRYDDGREKGFSSREILDAGHGFFGSVSKGLASVVEYTFRKQGRPNGYILGQDAGGAFVAGLRYGEGTLYTKDAGTHRVYWQGPSIGWDAGVEGSKVMVLVYNLRDPEDIYRRFGGVDGSAYLVGGAGVTFLQNDPVIVAPIRAGIGLRLGANVGYLKYTHRPTWNPF